MHRLEEFLSVADVLENLVERRALSGPRGVDRAAPSKSQGEFVLGLTGWVWLAMGLLVTPVVPGLTAASNQEERGESVRTAQAGREGSDRTRRYRFAPSAFQPAPLARDDAERKILDVLDEMERTGSRGGMSVPRDDGRLLRVLVESIDARRVVELGTFRGYSGIWMCAALRRTGGKLITFELDPTNAARAQQHFQRAEVADLVTIVEGDAHQEVLHLKGPIDLVFIDADKSGYADYFRKLLPLLRPGGLVVAHNIDPGRADPDFLDVISTNTDVESLIINAGSGGMSISMKKR